MGLQALNQSRPKDPKDAGRGRTNLTGEPVPAPPIFTSTHGFPHQPFNPTLPHGAQKGLDDAMGLKTED
jgi:hypothetical protein